MRTIPFLAISSLVFCASCIGDKTVQDYRREQVNIYLAQIQAISGVYNGTISYLQDNLSLGSFSLKIKPKTETQNSSDNLTQEPRSMVAAEISYTNAFTNRISFKQADYDDASGLFSASIPVTDDQNRTTTLELQGKISGGQFNGTIEADGFPEYGGALSLTKNGPATAPQALVASMSSRLEALRRSESDTYKGVATLDGESTPVSMTFNYADSNFATQFVNLFRPVRPLAVHLNYENWYSVDYSYAHIDDRAGILIAEGMKNTAKVSLQCTADHPGGVVKEWNCNNGQMSFTLAARQARQPETGVEP